MNQDELLRTVRRVLIAQGYEPSRVKTGWHRHNKREGYVDAGFYLTARRGSAFIEHRPNFSIGTWDLERREQRLEQFIGALKKAGFEPALWKAAHREGVGYYGSVYQIEKALVGELDLSCIAQGIQNLHESEQQAIQGSLNARTPAAHQQWQDWLRHDRYLLKLLGAK